VAQAGDVGNNGVDGRPAKGIIRFGNEKTVLRFGVEVTGQRF